MSIAALRDTAQELRRLAIAGSGLAKDDFRLKKLLPPLKKSGERAPVFAKVAGAVEALVEGADQGSPGALLAVTTLVNAILHTQLQTGVDGELEDLPSYGVTLSSRPAAAKTIRSVIEALTQTGSGRLEVVQDAHGSGLFGDLRLLQPALASFDDPYPELAEFMQQEVIPAYGRAILPMLRERFDEKSGTSADQRRLRVMIALMDRDERRELCLGLLEQGSKEIRAAALEGLVDVPEARQAILDHTSDRSQDVRAAAYRALAGQDDVLEPLLEALTGKDSDLVVEPLGEQLARSAAPDVAERLTAFAESYLAELEEKKRGRHVGKLCNLLRVLSRDRSGTGVAFLLALYERRRALERLPAATKTDINGRDLVSEIRELLALSDDERAADALLAELDLKKPRQAFEACVRTKSPAFVYETFHPIFTSDGYKRQARDELAHHMLYGYHHGAWGYHRWTLERDRIAERTWDPRWIDAAIARNYRPLAFALLRPGHTPGIQFAEDIAKDWDDGDGFDALRALARTDYDGWMALLTHRLASYKGAGRRRWMSPFEHQFLGAFPFDRLTDEQLRAAEELPFGGDEDETDALRARLSEERFRRLQGSREPESR